MMVISVLALAAAVILSASAVVVMWGDGDWWSPRPPQETMIEETDPALALLLLSALLEAGSSVAGALGSLGQCLPGREGRELRQTSGGLLIGLPWEESWPAEGSAPAARLIREALGPAATTGAPGADSLASMANSYRSAWRSAARIQAQKAGVELLLPLAVCHLPAFLLLGVGIFGLALLRSLWGDGA